MSGARVLIAGVGNVLRGDDGFGPEVVRALAGRRLPEGVAVKDFGIRGVDLAFGLLDGWDGAVLVDASARGGTPGTLYVLEPDGAGGAAADADGHGMNPMRMLALVHALGGTRARLRVIGCEPEQVGDEDELVLGLSASVARAVEPAARLALEVAEALLVDVAGGRPEVEGGHA